MLGMLVSTDKKYSEKTSSDLFDTYFIHYDQRASSEYSPRQSDELPLALAQIAATCFYLCTQCPSIRTEDTVKHLLAGIIWIFLKWIQVLPQGTWK